MCLESRVLPRETELSRESAQSGLTSLQSTNLPGPAQIGKFALRLRETLLRLPIGLRVVIDEGRELRD